MGEYFGEKVLGPSGLFLKVAGGSKAEVVTAAVRRAPSQGSILEIGTYCGFSAMLIAIACPGVHIVTLEMDPAQVVIARSMLAFAELSHMVDVWTGPSKDLLHRLDLRYKGKPNLAFRGVFMDHKGSRFPDDLQMLENQGLLLSGAMVVADN